MALLVAVGLILFVFESHVPRPLPWMKLGLGNLAVLLALVLYGSWAALVVVSVKVFLGSLFVGSFLGPAFFLAAGGGIVSAGTMGLVHYLWRRYFSVVGISILGAVSHNLIQLILAYLLFVKQVELLFLLPVFLISGLVTGGLVGLLAHWILIRKAFFL